MDERERLLSAIAADPDAIANWIVYADWLSDRGDPRGELIALELAMEAQLANDEIVARHRGLMRDETAFMSPRLEAEWHHVDVELWRGFIRGARVFGPEDDRPTNETMAALFADPHACILRRLDLWSEAAPLLEGLRHEGVRELQLSTSEPELAIATFFPELESFQLREEARTGLARLEHPKLTSFQGLCPALRTGHFDLPNLRRLILPRDPMEMFDTGILQRPPPRLVDVTVYESSAELVESLRASPLCARLQALALHYVDDVATFEELLREPAALQHIQLDVRGNVETAEERDVLVARFETAFPGITLDIGAADAFEPEPVDAPPETVTPTVKQGIGDAVMRLVEKMKARLPQR